MRFATQAGLSRRKSFQLIGHSQREIELSRNTIALEDRLKFKL